jgi:hypothetical protein
VVISPLGRSDEPIGPEQQIEKSSARPIGPGGDGAFSGVALPIRSFGAGLDVHGVRVRTGEAVLKIVAFGPGRSTTPPSAGNEPAPTAARPGGLQGAEITSPERLRRSSASLAEDRSIPTGRPGLVLVDPPSAGSDAMAPDADRSASDPTASNSGAATGSGADSTDQRAMVPEAEGVTGPAQATTVADAALTDSTGPEAAGPEGLPAELAMTGVPNDPWILVVLAMGLIFFGYTTMAAFSRPEEDEAEGVADRALSSGSATTPKPLPVRTSAQTSTQTGGVAVPRSGEVPTADHAADVSIDLSAASAASLSADGAAGLSADGAVSLSADGAVDHAAGQAEGEASTATLPVRVRRTLPRSGRATIDVLAERLGGRSLDDLLSDESGSEVAAVAGPEADRAELVAGPGGVAGGVPEGPVEHLPEDGEPSSDAHTDLDKPLGADVDVDDVPTLTAEILAEAMLGSSELTVPESAPVEAIDLSQDLELPATTTEEPPATMTEEPPATTAEEIELPDSPFDDRSGEPTGEVPVVVDLGTPLPPVVAPEPAPTPDRRKLDHLILELRSSAGVPAMSGSSRVGELSQEQDPLADRGPSPLDELILRPDRPRKTRAERDLSGHRQLDILGFE